MTSSVSLLPDGFSRLEKFVGKWAKDTTQERIEARCVSSQEEIREFYEEVLSFGEQAMAELSRYPLNDMPDTAKNLARLMLSLVQASVAIEIHGQPRAIAAPYPNSVTVTKGATPFG